MSGLENEILKIKYILDNTKISFPMIIKINNKNQNSIINDYFNNDDILKINLNEKNNKKLIKK